MNLKRILVTAMALEALKFVALFVAAKLFLGMNNEFVNAVLAITFFVILIPEMLVSYEQGPHGVLAYLIMFSAGTIVNLLLLTCFFSFWNDQKADVKTETVDLLRDSE